MTGDGEVTRRESRNTGERDIESIKQELATAVGLAALTDASLHEVAERAGVSRVELEECLESESLADPLDVDRSGDVREELDKLFEERRSR